MLAIGYEPDDLLEKTTPGLRTTNWKTVRVDEDFQTTRQGVFAGGDNVNGADLVVTAMADGRRAAAAIAQLPELAALASPEPRTGVIIYCAMRAAAIGIALLISLSCACGGGQGATESPSALPASSQTAVGEPSTTPPPTPNPVPAECSETYKIPQDMAITREVLAETSTDPLFDTDQWNTVHAEVANVLQLAQEQVPGWTKSSSGMRFRSK